MVTTATPPETEFNEATYSGACARVRVLVRLQGIARLLLACGPGDFLGKKEAAALRHRFGPDELGLRFERVRQIWRKSFEPILMEMCCELPQPLPWLKWVGLPCGVEERFEFALIHVCTVASRELFFYRAAGMVEEKADECKSNWLIAPMESKKLKSEADVTLAALEFDTPSRHRVQAKVGRELDAIARIFDYQTARRAEDILNRPSRTIGSIQPSWLQQIFLDFWDEFPKKSSGDPICDRHGLPLPPLCLFDDKSTRQIIHVFARGSSIAPASIRTLSDAAINKTWRRLGLVRARKPLFFTSDMKRERLGQFRNLDS